MEASSPRPRQVAWGLLIAGFIAFLLAARGALLPFFLAAVLSYLLHPLVCQLEARAVPRPVAIVILYIGIAILLWAAARLLLPTLGREIHELAHSLPRQTERLEGLTRRTVEDAQTLELPAAQDVIQVFLQRIQRLLESFASRLADLLVALAGSLFHVALAPVLAFFLLRDWELIRDGFLAALPSSARPHVWELAKRIDGVVAGYVRGQLIVSALVGGLAACALWLLQVPYALVVGLFAGLADIVPYFGPVLGTIPAVALAFGVSPEKALYVLLAFALIQQVESSILSPHIVGQSVGLHPLSVIGAVLVGAQWMGVLGMIIGVPLVSAAKVVWHYWREMSQH